MIIDNSDLIEKSEFCINSLFSEFCINYTSYLNGNITDFKKWLSEQDGDILLKFIRWLQAEGLKI